MSEAQANGKKLRLWVNMLGQFQVIGNERVLNEETIHSEMVTKLLSYFLVHHNRIISVQELSEVLWTEADSENPAGALKNLMYRLRNTTKSVFGDEKLILTSRGSYSWNSEIELQLDFELFEKMYKKGKEEEGNPDDRISFFEEAVRLYQGDFLNKLSSEHWVIPIATYYHSMYLTAVKQLVALYEEKGCYEEMESVCSKATNFDLLDEKLHYYIIKALKCQGKQNLAIDHYKKTTDLLYENLGIRPSEQMKTLYQELMAMQGGDEANLDQIQDDLVETENPDGVFLCEYGVFREIYRLEARRISRLGISEYLLLITLSPTNQMMDEGDFQRQYMKKAMNSLQLILQESLRVGDVASRYSNFQYVVMLPTCAYEAADMVANRIVSKFYSIYKYNRITIHYDLEEITLNESKLI